MSTESDINEEYNGKKTTKKQNEVITNSKKSKKKASKLTREDVEPKKSSTGSRKEKNAHMDDEDEISDDAPRKSSTGGRKQKNVDKNDMDDEKEQSISNKHAKDEPKKLSNGNRKPKKSHPKDEESENSINDHRDSDSDHQSRNYVKKNASKKSDPVFNLNIYNAICFVKSIELLGDINKDIPITFTASEVTFTTDSKSIKKPPKGNKLENVNVVGKLFAKSYQLPGYILTNEDENGVERKITDNDELITVCVEKSKIVEKFKSLKENVLINIYNKRNKDYLYYSIGGSGTEKLNLNIDYIPEAISVPIMNRPYDMPNITIVKEDFVSLLNAFKTRYGAKSDLELVIYESGITFIAKQHGSKEHGKHPYGIRDTQIDNFNIDINFFLMMIGKFDKQCVPRTPVMLYADRDDDGIPILTISYNVGTNWQFRLFVQPKTAK